MYPSTGSKVCFVEVVIDSKNMEVVWNRWARLWHQPRRHIISDRRYSSPKFWISLLATCSSVSLCEGWYFSSKPWPPEKKKLTKILCVEASLFHVVFGVFDVCSTFFYNVEGLFSKRAVWKRTWNKFSVHFLKNTVVPSVQLSSALRAWLQTTTIPRGVVVRTSEQALAFDNVHHIVCEAGWKVRGCDRRSNFEWYSSVSFWYHFWIYKCFFFSSSLFNLLWKAVIYRTVIDCGWQKSGW